MPTEVKGAPPSAPPTEGADEEVFRLPQPRAAFTGDVPYGRAGESRSGLGDHAQCQDVHDPLLLAFPAQSETCGSGKSASTPTS